MAKVDNVCQIMLYPMISEPVKSYGIFQWFVLIGEKLEVHSECKHVKRTEATERTKWTMCFVAQHAEELST